MELHAPPKTGNKYLDNWLERLYEELQNVPPFKSGPLTPGISFGDGTTGITYDTQTGRYYCIDDFVIVMGRVKLTSKGTSTGTAEITGLPFTCSAHYGVASLYFNTITFANVFLGLVTTTTTKIRLYEVTEAGVVTFLDDTNFANSSDIIFTAIYQKAS